MLNQRQMEAKKRKFLQKKCRVCFSTEENMYNLFSVESSKILERLVECVNGDEIIQSNEIPNHICELCKSKLVIASNFRRKFLKSNDFLKDKYSYVFKQHENSCNKNNECFSVESENESDENITTPDAYQSNSDVEPEFNNIKTDDEYEENEGNVIICDPYDLPQEISFTKYDGDVISLYNDDEFENRFHLTKQIYNYFFEKLSKVVTIKNTHRPQVFVHRQILATLEILTSTSSFLTIAKQYSLQETTLMQGFNRIVRDTIKLKNDTIKWPSSGKITELCNSNLSEFCIPNIIGMIGAVKINLKANKDNDHMNRNNYQSKLLEHWESNSNLFTKSKNELPNSVILQAACTNNLEFISCDVINCKSDKVYSLEESEFFKEVNCNTKEFFPNEEKLIGNAGYSCYNWLIPPLSEKDVVSQRESYFNGSLSTCMNTLNKAFSLLFGRFPRLKQFTTRKQDHILDAVLAACILHNICLKFEETNRIRYEFVESEHTTNNLIFQTNKVIKKLILNSDTAINQRNDLVDQVWNIAQWNLSKDEED